MSASDAQMVGARVRRARTECGISQQLLCARVHAASGILWYQTTVNKVEAGNRQLHLSEAVAIADALGISLDEIAYGGEIEAQSKIRRGNIAAAHSALASIRAAIDTEAQRWA